jgi:hypothetical protein
MNFAMHHHPPILPLLNQQHLLPLPLCIQPLLEPPGLPSALPASVLSRRPTCPPWWLPACCPSPLPHLPQTSPWTQQPKSSRLAQRLTSLQRWRPTLTSLGCLCCPLPATSQVHHGSMRSCYAGGLKQKSKGFTIQYCLLWCLQKKGCASGVSLNDSRWYCRFAPLLLALTNEYLEIKCVNLMSM